jgi:hypothetical protein
MSRYARRQSVKAVAAPSAGARSASLDAAKAISDLAATRSQLLIRSPRQRERSGSLRTCRRASLLFRGRFTGERGR